MNEEKCCTTNNYNYYYGCCDGKVNGGTDTPTPDDTIAVPTIGENGNWYIGGEDTDVSAKGEPGVPGEKGEPGVAGSQGPKGDTGDLNMESIFLRPDLWEAGKEYSFGKGLYGRRFTGTITAAVGAYNNTNLIVSSPAINPMAFGGYFMYSNSSLNTTTARLSIPSLYGDYTSAVYWNGGNVMLSTKTPTARTNTPYDVWIKYTK